MADPTSAQRMQFAKMGLAMPDGTYYIRKGAQGATDLQNAIDAVGRASGSDGTSDEQQRNTVRRHIIKRANALKLSDKIPDTWNADGTLAHAAVDEFLEHFGVKGMHWGVRHSRAELESKASEHEAKAKHHIAAASETQKQAEDLQKNGLQSEIFKRVYGNDSAKQSEFKFYAKNGITRAQALQETNNHLRIIHNSHVKAANKHSAKAADLRKKASEAEHSALDPEIDLGLDSYLDSEIDASLEHFGRKGMKWGEHVFGGKGKGSSSPPSDDSARASEIKGKVKTHGGIHVLSNKELEDLNKRVNLEQQYQRLNPEEVTAGKKFAIGILSAGGNVAGNVAKQQATTYANKYAAKGVEHLVNKSASK